MLSTFDVIPGRAIAPLLQAHRPEIVARVQMASLAHHRGHSALPTCPFLPLPDQPGGRIIAAPAYLGEPFHVAGIKWIASVPDNIRHNVPRASALLALNDPHTGYPYALLEGAQISAARTAASAVLAAQVLRYSARRVARLGVVGTGVIARTVYTFFHDLGWDIGAVCCHDVQRPYVEAFAAMVRDLGPTPVTVCDQAEDVLRTCDLSVLATTAGTPYLHAPDLLQHGPLLLHISLRDLAPELIAAACNVVDDVAHVLQAQTSVHLTAQALGHERFIAATLGQVLAGEWQAPETGALIFSPFGLGILDLAVGQYLYALAMAQGTQQAIPGFFHETTRW